MRIETARKVINNDKMAMKIARARGTNDYQKIKREARSLITKMNKRERRRK